MNLELLKDAYAIIDGIPDKFFNLNTWVEDACELGGGGCGTIACAGGWLAMHPKFNELGLKFKWTRGQGRGNNERYMTYKGFPEAPGAEDNHEVLARVFGITRHQSHNLFSGVGGSAYDRGAGRSVFVYSKSHKDVFKNRVIKFLRDNDPTYTK